MGQTKKVENEKKKETKCNEWNLMKMNSRWVDNNFSHEPMINE